MSIGEARPPLTLALHGFKLRPPSNSWARPCWAMPRVSANPSYAPELSDRKLPYIVILIR